MKNLLKYADALKAETIRIRRDLHKYAEAGLCEYRTASIIIHTLLDLGYDVRYGSDVMNAADIPVLPDASVQKSCMERAVSEGADEELVKKMADGMTGVVATINCGNGKTVAFRFDMDANDVTESKDAAHRPNCCGFASVHDDVMHACGHDGHVAIGLTLARIIAENKDDFTGKIKLIFQPAEEGVRGGIAMMKAGVVDDVDYFFGGHIGFTAKKYGTIVSSVGGFLASNKYDVTFRGKSVHAALAPESGRNALLAAAQATLALHAISRHSEGASRVNVGMLNAGSGRNVIPENAEMLIEVRGATTSINEYMSCECERMLRAAAEMYNVDVEIKNAGRAMSCDVDTKLGLEVSELAAQTGLFTDIVDYMDFGGGEDCTAFIRRVMELGGHGVYMLYGSELSAEHHNGRFDFNEDTLTLAAGFLACLAKKYTNFKDSAV